MAAKENPSTIPVTIQPQIVLGLRTEVIGNIHFGSKNEVIYPVENVLAFHDYVKNKQKFLRFADNLNPLIIRLSVNRAWMAIVEKIDGEVKPVIGIYEISTLKKRRTIELEPTEKHPQDFEEIADIAFAYDAKSLLVLTKAPEETIFQFMFDKNNTVVHIRTVLVNQRGSCSLLAPHPQDPNLTGIGGDNCLRFFLKGEENEVSITPNPKIPKLFIVSFVWISMDTVIAGTDHSTLMTIESSELRLRMDARSTTVIDLMKEPDDLDAEEADKEIGDVSSPENSVAAMTVFNRGFAYAIFNKVYVFERETRDKLERKTILTIKTDIYAEELYQITNLAVNVAQDTVIATTKHSQIYVGILIVPESLKTKILNFKPLGECLHIAGITHCSICPWRPIVLTAGKDQTLRIWNYETAKLELVKKYQVDITVAELSPLGLFVALGFSDQLRIVQILMDELKIIKTYNFPRCKDVKYSYLGHYMAAAFDNQVAITSVNNLEILRYLKGHNATVLTVGWSKDDKQLVTAGIDGAVYTWHVESGARLHEIVQKGIEYPTIAVTNPPQSVYAITNYGLFREIIDSEIIRDIKIPPEVPLTSMALSRSDLIMFIANKNGNLYNIQLPFMETGGGTITNYRFFKKPITKMCITYDGTKLITGSDSGTLGIWLLKNCEGRIAPMDADLLKSEEILIPRPILQDKIEAIANLELRLKQQLAEFQYQSKQTEIFDEQAMADIHKTYFKALEELRQKNDEMEKQHVEIMNQVGQEILNREEEHRVQFQDLGIHYSERIIAEYNKYVNLRTQMVTMRDNYEDKLRKSAGCLQDTIEALEIDFKKQLHERQELIRQLMQEMDDKKTEFIEYCAQVEHDNDRNMVESQLQYEIKLQNEQDETLKWRGESGVLQKKYEALTIETEKLNEECDILRVEHRSFKKEIERNLRINDDLRKELEERDYVISEKEKRIGEVMFKNQELEKYKQVLSHKITELKSQIEPRERQIKEKRDQIIEMEHELSGLNATNLQLELQLSEMKDKYLASLNELKVERDRGRLARNYSIKICTDIYNVGNNISSPAGLRDSVKKLYMKYANDRELKKTIQIDEQVQNEFQEQRVYLEGIIQQYRKMESSKSQVGKTQKLIQENCMLLDECALLRKQLKEAQNKVQLMENLIGSAFPGASALAVKQKVRKVLSDIEKIEADHKIEIEVFQTKLENIEQERKELLATIDTLRIRVVDVPFSNENTEIKKLSSDSDDDD